MLDISFILKKIISGLMYPLSIGLLFILLGLFMLYRNRTDTAKKILVFSFVWIVFFSYAPVSYMLLKPLEQKYSALMETPKDIKYILVLGSGHRSDSHLPITAQLNPVAVVRFTEGLRHYRSAKSAYLVVSGYSGLYDPNTHALMQKRLAISLGVDEYDIIMHGNAKDTEEEAIAMYKLVGDKPFILVTSASHMPRSYSIFKSLGLNPIPAPTDYSAGGEMEFLHMPSAQNLLESQRAFHEYIGQFWQWLKSLI